MPKQLSWAALHRMSPSMRRETATAALRSACEEKASFFSKDGANVILVTPERLFGLLFTGKVDARRAGNLIQTLRRHGVLESNGKRGRGGELRMSRLDSANDQAPPDTPAAEKKQVSVPNPVSSVKSTNVSLTELRNRLHHMHDAVVQEEEEVRQRREGVEAALQMVESLEGQTDERTLNEALALIGKTLS